MLTPTTLCEKIHAFVRQEKARLEENTAGLNTHDIRVRYDILHFMSLLGSFIGKEWTPHVRD